MDSTAALTRRQLLRLLGGATLAVVPALGVLERAGAARAWCRLDPTFRVEDLVGNVYVSGELDQAYDVTGPIQLRFTAPDGCTVELLASDPGFGQGYDVSYASDPTLKNTDKEIELRIDVFVPAVSDKLAILVEFVPDGVVKAADKKVGATNRWIAVKTELRRDT